MLADLHETSPDFTLRLKMLIYNIIYIMSNYWNFSNSPPLRKAINYKYTAEASLLESDWGSHGLLYMNLNDSCSSRRWWFCLCLICLHRGFLLPGRKCAQLWLILPELRGIRKASQKSKGRSGPRWMRKNHTKWWQPYCKESLSIPHLTSLNQAKGPCKMGRDD